MNAVEFIKQYGWETAKEILRESPVVDAELYSNMCYLKNAHSEGDVDHFALFCASSNCWVESSSENKLFIDNAIILRDLKQLVDALELVEKHGGLEHARDGEYLANGLGFGVTGLKQAIELVESVNEND